MIRMQCQRLIICGHGLRELPHARQRITAVVQVIRVTVFFQCINGALIVAGLVLRRTAPAWIPEQIRGARSVTVLQRPLALLIGTQPQVGPFHGLGRTRQRQRRQHQRQYQSTPEGQRGQRQQRQYQPGSLIAPDIGLQFRRLCLRLRRAPVE